MLPHAAPDALDVPAAAPAGQRLRDLSPAQWKSGVAAWLGWLFDGLDIHLYTLVAAPFVAELLLMPATSGPVKEKMAWIQAAFLVGWAVGGAVFGRLGDVIGRSRSLALTIATYAMFTGLSFFAQTWWQLLICRFLAALGIGGEWAVGSSLLSETWPPRWRAWVAAVLQTAVNIGILIACGAVWLLAGHHRAVFLVGVLPAVMVYWIRRHVPEPQAWTDARAAATPPKRGSEVIQRGSQASRLNGEGAGSEISLPETPDTVVAPVPGIGDLFRGPTRRTTLLTIAVCSCALTGWWAFLFWHVQHLRSLPEVQLMPKPDQDRLASIVFFWVIGVSIVGNFFASALAKLIGYRRSIAVMCLGFFLMIFLTYRVERDHHALLYWLPTIGFFSGVFALFTMYLPPLFPVLLRTTGAGFSYNIGRLAAAVGTVLFGAMGAITGAGSLRQALLLNGFLFLPAMLIALLLPELRDEDVVEPR